MNEEKVLLQRAQNEKAADRYAATVNATYKRIARNIKLGRPINSR